MNQEKILHKNIELWAKTCPKQALMLPYVNIGKLADCTTEQGEPNLKNMEEGFTYHSQSGAKAEADRWFQSLSLQDIPLVCVYGVGLGYYYDAIAIWLKKKRDRRLVFLEDDLAVIRKLLETHRGLKILQDQQVQLVYFEGVKKEDVFETFYWNFALTRMGVSSLQCYLEHKAPTLAELRHKLAYDAAMKNALVDEYMRYGMSFYLNFYQNMLLLPQSYLGNQFFGKFQKVPAIICGAGPSLAKNLPLLGSLLDKALVFAGGSALNVLNAAGIQPHFGAGIDPNPMQFNRLSQNIGFEVPFFYRNRMYHDAFKMIHGPRLYITGSGGYDIADYFEQQLKIPSEFLDEGHNVVNFCVEVANAMGCDPIIFAGMDLAFTGMREYAPGVVEDAAVSQSTILDIADEDSKALLKDDIFGKPTYTLWKWVAEANWIGDYAKEHPSMTMLNCTEGGLGFPGIPNIPLAQAAGKHLLRSYELKGRIHGETQNSAFKHVTYAKVSRIMKDLEINLAHMIDDFQILIEDAQNMANQLKSGKIDAHQSGRAALAETEIAESPAYKYVLEVFNEVYSRMLSGEVHDINVRRYSKKQRRLKKIALSLKKYAFLRNTAQINKELIAHAFRERKKIKRGVKPDIAIPPAIPGTYTFDKHNIAIDDPELSLNIHLDFRPVRVPNIRHDGEELENGHRLRVFFDTSWKLHECYVEKNGVPNGQCLLFYPDGSPKEECFYLDGNLHGPSTFWSQQGKILAKSWFINGQQTGKIYWYYPSGALYSLQRFLSGQWHGLQEFYYKNGNPKTLMTYDHGTLQENTLLLNPDGSFARQGALPLASPPKGYKPSGHR